MPVHDPLRFASALSGKLATRSRHVCAFLGAGVGRACGLPDVAELQKRIVSKLELEDPEGAKAFASQLKCNNLEQALSRLRRIASLLTNGQLVDDLNAKKAADLDEAVCQLIVKELAVQPSSDLKAVDDLAAWAARANYHLPLELFTINYDLLLETALDHRRIPYFDGFVGTMRARFHTELVEATPGKGEESVPAFFVRLWKLHGSVNWVWEDRQIVRLGQPVTKGLAAAIYPSDAKYEESRRVPFVVLQDRLRRALHQPETLVIIAGYSFRDDHLNELLFDAAARRQRSEFIAFCHSEIPEDLATRAISTPNFQVVGGREAVWGGVRGKWTTPVDPVPNLWENDQLALRDFRNLAAYLTRSTEPEKVAATVSPTTGPSSGSVATPSGESDA